MPHSIVIGASGQDGRILSEQLEKRGDRVFRWTRQDCDLGNAETTAAAIAGLKPDEIYYLAAHHHSSQEKRSESPLSDFQPMHEIHVNGLLYVLEGIRLFSPKTKLFYASSSHVFGNPEQSPQNENTPMRPLAPYGITKAAGMGLCRFYRQKYGVFASSGILYNHESQFRSEKFVTQKIIQAAKRIKAGSSEKLVLGQLEAKVDWGYAPDYTNAMQLILAAKDPDDFIVATGKVHTVENFLNTSFRALGLRWEEHVEIRQDLLQEKRSLLVGDSSKLQKTTGWKPKVGFEEMISLLCEH